MTQDDDGPSAALRKNQELAAAIVDLLRGLDHAESGFVLALCTSAWLRTFRTPDPDRQKEAYAELLTHHTTAIVRLLWGPDGPK